VHPPGSSLYHGYRNLIAERIRVRILGHVGRILRSYLHDLCDHGILTCYLCGRGSRICIFPEPCLAVTIPKIIGLILFDSHQIPPDGSEMSSLLSGVCHQYEVEFLLHQNSREFANHRVNDQRSR
jgi:hypothetical protein